MIDEWVQALEERNNGGLRLAELSYRAFNAPDFDYESLRAQLAERGYDVPEKPTLSKYKDAHAYWVVQRKTEPEKLKRVGLSKLYVLAKFLEVSNDNPQEWLEKAVGTSRERLQAEIAERPMQERRKSLVMPESLYERFEQGAQRLYGVNGFTSETLLAAVEFCTDVMSRADPSDLQALWRQTHGES